MKLITKFIIREEIFGKLEEVRREGNLVFNLDYSSKYDAMAAIEKYMTSMGLNALYSTDPPSGTFIILETFTIVWD